MSITPDGIRHLVSFLVVTPDSIRLFLSSFPRHQMPVFLSSLCSRVFSPAFILRPLAPHPMRVSFCVHYAMENCLDLAIRTGGAARSDAPTQTLIRHLIPLGCLPAVRHVRAPSPLGDDQCMPRRNSSFRFGKRTGGGAWCARFRGAYTLSEWLKGARNASPSNIVSSSINLPRRQHTLR